MEEYIFLPENLKMFPGSKSYATPSEALKHAQGRILCTTMNGVVIGAHDCTELIMGFANLVLIAAKKSGLDRHVPDHLKVLSLDSRIQDAEEVIGLIDYPQCSGKFHKALDTLLILRHGLY